MKMYLFFFTGDKSLPVMPEPLLMKMTQYKPLKSRWDGFNENIGGIMDLSFQVIIYCTKEQAQVCPLMG